MAGELLLSLLGIILLENKAYNPGFLAPDKLLVFYKHFQTGVVFIIFTKHSSGIFPSGLNFGGFLLILFVPEKEIRTMHRLPKASHHWAKCLSLSHIFCAEVIPKERCLNTYI